jgi:hypothetical protein
MSAVKRRLFQLLAALSLALCMAEIGMWTRSYYREDRVLLRTRTDGMWFNSFNGHIMFWHPRQAYDFPPTSYSSLQLFLNESPPSRADDGIKSARWRMAGFAFTPSTTVNPRFGGQSCKTSTALFVPYWFLVVLSVASALTVSRGTSRERRRTRAGCCLICGYDLRATPQRCPECGLLVKPTA